MAVPIQIDHINYPKRIKTLTVQELRYIISDAHAAIKANPDNPKAGYYQDEINYAGMELQRRRSVSKS